MDIDLTTLNYKFIKKPLLVGGRAKEYYGVRKSGKDIDLVVSKEDIKNLIKLYPERAKDLWGDLGVCPLNFEIWKTICYYDYDYLKEGAIETDKYLVISLEKLLFMTALAMKKEKYLADAKLIVSNIFNRQAKLYKRIDDENKSIINSVTRISYIEKIGPGEKQESDKETTEILSIPRVKKDISQGLSEAKKGLGTPFGKL